MQTLRELTRYNRWANARLLARCREADAAEHVFGAAGGTIGTIEETLKHVALVEESYLTFMSGRDPLEGHPDRESFLAEYLGHDFEWFADRVADLDRQYEQMAGQADEAFLAGQFRLPWFDFPLTREQGLLQVFSHSTTHRVQVFSTLGERGLAVPDVDYVQMLQEERRSG
jgi:uncharacterized damage-inducible protein DinB